MNVIQMQLNTYRRKHQARVSKFRSLIENWIFYQNFNFFQKNSL